MHPEMARLDALVGWRDIAGPLGPIRWRHLGQGSPLVLLHGGHGSWLHWLRNIEALARDHTVWVPDMPGYFDSADAPSPRGPDDIEPLLAVLQCTLDRAVGAQTPVDLAGFSFGGLVAARLAARRPHVRRLALLGSGGHGTPRPRMLDMLPWRKAESDAQRRDMLRHNLNALMLWRHEPDELALAIHEASCMATRFRSRAASLGGGLRQALRDYGGPVLLVWGARDVTAVAEAVAPFLAADGPHRQWRIVPDAGHWVQYEAAAEVNGLLARWFAGRPLS